MSGSRLFEDISIVVPVYNAGKYLHAALESIHQQTYPYFEAILVNDGSTDNSKDICLEFTEKDPRFRLINQKNSGVSAARNAGIDKAKGEWIAFMDADDLMTPDCLAILWDTAKQSKTKIAVGDYSRKYPINRTGEDFKMTVVDSETAIIYGLYQKFILNNPWGVLFHRTVFTTGKPLRFRECRYEDLDIFYQAFDRVDKICLVDVQVYYYRDTPGSFINTWSDSRLDVLDVTDRMAEYFKGRDVKLQNAAADRRFSAHYNMLIEMYKNGVNLPHQEVRCWETIKQQRYNEIIDRNVRLKNKLGAMVSYLGKPAIRLLCKL